MTLSVNTLKNGMNALNLKKCLGLGSYQTALNWLQNLRRCTIQQDREKLSDRVEVDKFTICGQRSGKRGRSTDGKVIVACAVVRNDNKKQTKFIISKLLLITASPAKYHYRGNGKSYCWFGTLKEINEYRPPGG